jgi:hypothetical protein
MSGSNSNLLLEPNINLTDFRQKYTDPKTLVIDYLELFKLSWNVSKTTSMKIVETNLTFILTTMSENVSWYTTLVAYVKLLFGFKKVTTATTSCDYLSDNILIGKLVDAMILRLKSWDTGLIKNCATGFSGLVTKIKTGVANVGEELNIVINDPDNEYLTESLKGNNATSTNSQASFKNSQKIGSLNGKINGATNRQSFENSSATNYQNMLKELRTKVFKELATHACTVKLDATTSQCANVNDLNRIGVVYSYNDDKFYFIAVEMCDAQDNRSVLFHSFRDVSIETQNILQFRMFENRTVNKEKFDSLEALIQRAIQSSADEGIYNDQTKNLTINKGRAKYIPFINLSDGSRIVKEGETAVFNLASAVFLNKDFVYGSTQTVRLPVRILNKIQSGGLHNISNNTRIFYKGYHYKIRQEGRRKFIKTKGGDVSVSDVKKWQKTQKTQHKNNHVSRSVSK